MSPSALSPGPLRPGRASLRQRPFKTHPL
jgi:hypothetical protein